MRPVSIQDLALGASVRCIGEGEARTGIVVGFYRREPQTVAVQLADRTVEVPLPSVELIVAQTEPPLAGPS